MTAALSRSGGDPAAEPFRFDLDDVLLRDAETLADMMVRCAVALCVTARGYAHQARGPESFDDVGFVRAVVQGALDWHAYRNLQARPGAIADLADYPEDQARYNPNKYAALLEEWGLARARASGVVKSAQPGDIMLYMGRGPAFGVVIAPWSDVGGFNGPAGAYARAPNPPRVTRDGSGAFSGLALFRWPEVSR